MKKTIFSLVSMLLPVMQTFAQTGNGAVTGVLKEKSSGMPVEFAAIALHEAATDRMVTGCVTDSTGQFRINKVSVGRYYLECSFVGCETVETAVFSVAKGASVDLGTLYMAEGEELAEVVVEGRRPTFTARLDRKVFNVGQDLMSTSGSASDLMQNIPSVEVDMDGTVSLRGNENVTILIDGKPSAMMGAKTRGDALNQLPASGIERIEVITNPSAEYKPDGVSGVINIVLKKDARAGLNGTLNGNAGSYGRYNAGLNLIYGLKGLNIFGGYAFRRDRYDRTIDDHRSSAASDISQATRGLGRPVSHTVRLGATANITAHDAVEVAGNYNRRRFRRSERVESETIGTDGTLTDFYMRDRDALALENMWEGTLHYTHSYGNDSEWGADYTYSSETEDEMNHYSTLSMSGDTKDNESVWDANYMHIAKLHWRHNVSERLKLTAGYEMEHLRAEQDYHVSELDGAAFVPDASRSSDFTYRRTLHSLYAMMEMKLADWSLLAGLRGEYERLSMDIPVNGVTSDGTSIGNVKPEGRTSLYPTLHISRSLGAHHELQLSYSLRVNRPEGSDMNPFAERINPLSLQAGNPDLKPEKIHSVEAGWLWRTDGGMSLMSTFYYRYLTNQITEVSRYIDDGVLLTTKENLNTSRNAGVELIWNVPAARWLSFNWNVNGYYSQIDATRLGFGANHDTFSWSTLLNANFTPVSHYMIQLNARFRGATLVPQGRRDSDCRINLGMKYDIPSAGLSLTASVTDLFDTYRKSYTLDTPELKQKVEKRRNPRIFYIGVAWQFGAGKGKRHQTEVEYDEGM